MGVFSMPTERRPCRAHEIPISLYFRYTPYMQSRRKVLYVITKSVWGGAQKYVYDVATYLPRDQFDVTVITGGQGPLVEKLARAGVRTITLPTLQEGGGIFEAFLAPVNIRLLISLVKIFRREHPDAVHLNSSKIGGIGAIAAFFYNSLQATSCKLQATIVFTVHGWAFKEDRPRWQKITIWLFSYLSSLFHDIVILINTADYQSACRFIPKRKLRLIPNGIEPIDFLSHEEARLFFAKKIGRPITSDAILIGTIAEFTKNKGLPYLIDTLSSLQPASYKLQAIFIGHGEDQQRLEARIHELGLHHTIFLLPLPADAKRYLKGLDIFVLPSLKEGLPYALMEAMAAGLPVIAASVGGIPDLVTHGQNGILVPPKNPAMLKAALHLLLEDPLQRRALGQRAQETIQEKFQLIRMMRETIKVYS